MGLVLLLLNHTAHLFSHQVSEDEGGVAAGFAVLSSPALVD